MIFNIPTAATANLLPSAFITSFLQRRQRRQQQPHQQQEQGLTGEGGAVTPSPLTSLASQCPARVESQTCGVTLNAHMEGAMASSSSSTLHGNDNTKIKHDDEGWSQSLKNGDCSDIHSNSTTATTSTNRLILKSYGKRKSTTTSSSSSSLSAAWPFDASSSSSSAINNNMTTKTKKQKLPSSSSQSSNPFDYYHYENKDECMSSKTDCKNNEKQPMIVNKVKVNNDYEKRSCGTNHVHAAVSTTRNHTSSPLLLFNKSTTSTRNIGGSTQKNKTIRTLLPSSSSSSSSLSSMENNSPSKNTFTDTILPKSIIQKKQQDRKQLLANTKFTDNQKNFIGKADTALLQVADNLMNNNHNKEEGGDEGEEEILSKGGKGNANNNNIPPSNTTSTTNNSIINNNNNSNFDPLSFIPDQFEQMGNALRCPICQCTLSNPSLLPCIHAFCSSCLQSYFATTSTTSRSYNNEYCCPICKLKITKRSIISSQHLQELVLAYKAALRAFGLTPIVYSPSVELTQMIPSPPPAADEDEEEEEWNVNNKDNDCMMKKKKAIQIQHNIVNQETKNKNNNEHCSTTNRNSYGDSSNNNTSIIATKQQPSLTECHEHLHVSRAIYERLQHRVNETECKNIPTTDSAVFNYTDNNEARVGNVSWENKSSIGTTTTTTSTTTSSIAAASAGVATVLSTAEAARKKAQWAVSNQRKVIRVDERALVEAAVVRQHRSDHKLGHCNGNTEGNNTSLAQSEVYPSDEDMTGVHIGNNSIMMTNKNDGNSNVNKVTFANSSNIQSSSEQKDKSSQSGAESVRRKKHSDSNVLMQSQVEDNPSDEDMVEKNCTTREKNRSRETNVRKNVDNDSVNEDPPMQNVVLVQNSQKGNSKSHFDLNISKITNASGLSDCDTPTSIPGHDSSNKTADWSEATIAWPRPTTHTQDSIMRNNLREDEAVNASFEHWLEEDDGSLKGGVAENQRSSTEQNSYKENIQPAAAECAKPLGVAARSDNEIIIDASSRRGGTSNCGRLETHSSSTRTVNTVLKVGDVVNVEPRTWPGMNKLGGVGKVTAVQSVDAEDYSGSTEQLASFSYDVAYVLGGKEKRVDASYVHLAESFAIAEDNNLDECSSAVLNTSKTRKRRSRSSTTTMGELKQSRPKESSTHSGSARDAEIINVSTADSLQLKSLKGSEGNILMKTDELQPEIACSLADEWYARVVNLSEKTVYIATSSISEYTVSLLDLFVVEMNRVGVTICLQKDFEPNQTTLCITAPHHSGSHKGLFSSVGASRFRTLKLMRAAVAAVPIVTPEWIDECLKSKHLVSPKGTVCIRTLPAKVERCTNNSATLAVHEDAALDQTLPTSSFGVARIAAIRMLRQKEGQKNKVPKQIQRSGLPFQNVSIVLCGTWDKNLGPKRADMQHLIKECDAVLISSATVALAKVQNIIRSSPAEQREYVIFLCDNSISGKIQGISKSISRALENASVVDLKGILIVSFTWLFDYISCGRLPDDVADYVPCNSQAKKLWKICTSK